MVQSKYHGLHKAMMISIENGRLFPTSPYTMDIMDILAYALHKVGTKQQTVEQGLQEAQTQALKICQQCFLLAEK